MKRTTYILIGLLVSGLLVIVAAIILMAWAGEKRKISDIFFENEQVQMDLNGVHVVNVFVSQANAAVTKRIIMDGEMEITSSSSASGKEQISFPKGERVHVTQKNDTLSIELDFNAGSIPEKARDDDYIFANGLHIQMALDSLTTIITYARGIKVNLRDIETDSLFIRSNHQGILLDSCRFRSFDLAGDAVSCHAKNSKIENYYLNLDGIRRWTFENTEVGTEYLTGSEHHSNDLQRGECRRVVWTPMNKEAQLQVTIREKSEIILSPE